MMVGRLVDLGRILLRTSKREMREFFRSQTTRRGLASIVAGIAEHGVTRPQLLGAPFLVVWDFTHVCNLKCKHCYQRADKPLPDELTTGEARDLIRELADADVVAIAFSGGEPLLRPDFFELAAYARSLGIHVSVATNGTTLTKEVARRLKEIDINYVEISLDGARAETHDEFRGIPGMFERTIQGIKNCVEVGLYTCIATTATKHNLNELQATYELAVELGCKRHMIFNFIPTGRGVELVQTDLSPEEREEQLNQIYNNLTSGRGCEAFSTAPQLARIALERVKEGGGPLVSAHFAAQTDLGEQTRLIAEFLGGCGAGRCYCAIEPNGDVLPCVFMPIKAGNIRETPFVEIWRNSPILNDLRDRSKLKGHCAVCEYRYACGGCRARAYGYFGDYHAPDPGCIRNLEYWQRLKQRVGS
jgi:radical SAM protein with 4Fe4S-binding SPASM domain